MVTAFVAFTGVAALVPGGLPEPGATGPRRRSRRARSSLLALGDALVALALGYRVAAARYGTVRAAARSAITYAIVIAVAAGAIRALDVPRLVGPGALTLVFYLWDALHATAPDRRREPRFVWETLLLGVARGRRGRPGACRLASLTRDPLGARNTCPRPTSPGRRALPSARSARPVPTD